MHVGPSKNLKIYFKTTLSLSHIFLSIVDFSIAFPLFFYMSSIFPYFTLSTLFSLSLLLFLLSFPIFYEFQPISYLVSPILPLLYEFWPISHSLSYLFSPSFPHIS